MDGVGGAVRCSAVQCSAAHWHIVGDEYVEYIIILLWRRGKRIKNGRKMEGNE